MEIRVKPIFIPVIFIDSKRVGKNTKPEMSVWS